MAYIPPHKRHIKGSPSPKPTPAPDYLIASFRKNLNFKQQQQKRNEKYLGVKNTVYAENAVMKWFTVGLADEEHKPSLVKLEHVPVESFELKSGQKPLSLVLTGGCRGSNELIDKPWLLVAANVKQDLLLSLQRMKCEMEESDLAEVKPSVVARLGKILFYGMSRICQESLKTNPLSEATLRQLKRSFHTSVPPSYLDYIENRVVEKLGLEYMQEKELYYVKLSDKLQPDSTVSCKCTVTIHKKIQLNKIELNRVRHMVADMSCLGKSSDLRLILYTKRIKLTLSDEEISEIKDLIGSAILDSEVQGGLRWPFGKDSSGGRYSVISNGHVTAKSYRNSSIRFKFRHADRFDFRSSTGEVAQEIFLKMPGIISQLRKQTIEEELVFKMLEDSLKLIWDHCLLEGSSS